MAAFRLAPRALLYGIVFGASAFAANPSGAAVAQVVAVGVALHEHGGHPAEAWLQLVDWGRFCDWHSRHPLCRQVNDLSLSCEQQPDDALCAEEDDDGFCRDRPDHPLCGDDRFCEKRPDHPLCDDPPPSPS